MHLISFHSITISLELENIFSILLLPGTIIEVIVPLSKSAHTSCTNPSLLPSFMFITSLCLKSKKNIRNENLQTSHPLPCTACSSVVLYAQGNHLLPGPQAWSLRAYRHRPRGDHGATQGQALHPGKRTGPQAHKHVQPPHHVPTVRNGQLRQ